MSNHHWIVTMCGVVLVLSGCALNNAETKNIQVSTQQSAQAAIKNEPTSTPVIIKNPGLWLMGQSVKVSLPLSPELNKEIVYHPAQKVSVLEIISNISMQTKLAIDISEIQSAIGNNTVPTGANLPTGIPSIPTQASNFNGNNTSQSQSMPSMSVNYQGPASGLLDLVAGKMGVWWKFVDDKVLFFRTETRTFYLPVNAGKSVENNNISTATGSSSGSSNGGSGGASSSGGANMSTDYTVDIWADLAKTAKVVGAGAQIDTNPSAGSLSVTGTPSQVRAVAEWIKGLTEQLSQQVVISMQMYRIKVSNADAMNWNPSIIFSRTGGGASYSVTPGTALSVVGGATPVSLGMNILTSATGSLAELSGSQVAFNALSSLGNISQTFQRTVVTMSGQPAPIQVANQQGFLASSSTTQTANVGATTTQTPGTVTTGLTGTFLPRVVNGRIVLKIAMTTSTLLGLTTIGNSTTLMQAPNVDVNTLQQTVTLKPDDAILLTGIQQENTNSNESGVGSVGNKMFGGGSNSSTEKTIIAIVISAKVL